MAVMENVEQQRCHTQLLRQEAGIAVIRAYCPITAGVSLPHCDKENKQMIGTTNRAKERAQQ